MTDGFGYSSRAEYDLRFGVATRETDINALGYDLRGLRTSLDNPDDGLIEDQYDLMGNRIALIEPNHRASGPCGR
jgi:hypothetical protein